MAEEEQWIETQNRVRLIEMKESRGLKWHTEGKWMNQCSYTMEVKTLVLYFCSVKALVRPNTLMKVV